MIHKHFKTKAKFNEELNKTPNSGISDSDICFIKDTAEIWTHGKFYKGTDTDTNDNTTYQLSTGTGGDANKIVLTPSSGTADKITVPYATNAGTVNSHTVNSDVPANASFDPHYSSEPVAGGSSATTNATSKTSDPYINIVENGSKVGGVQIKGGGGTDVSAKDGVITVNSTAHPTTTEVAPTAKKVGHDSLGHVVLGDNLTNSDVGLGNVTNYAQVKGLASGTTEDHVVVFGTDGYSVKDSGKTIGVSVPVDAKFTDSHHDGEVTADSGHALMKVKVDSSGIWTKEQISIPSAGSITSGDTGFVTGGDAYTALAGKADLVDGVIPESQLPSYVDDVIELLAISNTAPATCAKGDLYYNTSTKKIVRATAANTWGTGATTNTVPESGKIYINLTDSKTYRWGGSSSGLVVISETLALGETEATAYRGDRGKTAYDHSQSTHARVDATKVEASGTNGNIKIDGTETTVYTHPTGDGYSHVPATGTTNNGKVLMAGSAANSASWQSLPEASSSVAGITIVGASGGAAAYSHGNHVPTTETANNARFLRNDNTWQTVTPSGIGAAEASHGTHVTTDTVKTALGTGSAISNQTQTTKFLREDGSWATPSYTVDTNTTYKLTIGDTTNGDSASGVDLGTLGTAALKDVPGSGDASNTQVVLGSDSRLANNIRVTIEKTWSELKALRDNSTLVPGQWYRITDYVTTTTTTDTQSAGYAFDIIVRADRSNALNENAYAAKHSGDLHFSSDNMSAWELKYCINNDTDRFAWADSTNGKGVIYYMKDEFNNECPYDFKNIRFKVGAKTQPGTKDNVYYYTFSASTVTNDTTVTDHSRNGGYCHDNCIKRRISSGRQTLNFNIFRNTSNSSDCYNNTFGNSCSDNTFGNSCSDNTFRNYCSSNTFGNSCSDNTFGNSCSDNTFRNYCSSNTFGNSCSSNTFGKNCYNNTFGNYCSSNTFVNSCSDNTFRNSCSSNTFVNSCSSNTFGNSCSSNTFGKNYTYYVIVENGNKYITLTSTQTTSSSYKLQNIKIAQGVNNTTTTKTISHDTVNDAFQTEYKATNSQTILI